MYSKDADDYLRGGGRCLPYILKHFSIPEKAKADPDLLAYNQEVLEKKKKKMQVFLEESRKYLGIMYKIDPQYLQCRMKNPTRSLLWVKSYTSSFIDKRRRDLEFIESDASEWEFDTFLEACYDDINRGHRGLVRPENIARHYNFCSDAIREFTNILYLATRKQMEEEFYFPEFGSDFDFDYFGSEYSSAPCPP